MLRAPAGTRPRRERGIDGPSRRRESSIAPDARTPPPRPPSKPPGWPRTRSTPAGRRARGEARGGLGAGSPAAGEARHRPDGARHPPRPRGRAAASCASSRTRATVVVLIIGDYTARVGDPSGRSTPAPDALRGGDRRERGDLPGAGDADPRRRPARLEVRRNSEWLDMPMTDLLGARAHDDRGAAARARRLRQTLAGRGADLAARAAVPAAAGLRLGGGATPTSSWGGPTRSSTCCSGATSSAHYGRPQQAILTMPILVGTDGARKMSKSLGNQIGITDPPEEMYGKTMSIPDEAMEEYYRLLVTRARRRPARGGGRAGGQLGARRQAHARAGDRRLAALRRRRPQEAERRLRARVRPARAAARRSRRRGCAAEDGIVHLPALIAEQFGISRSEARRLIDQGGGLRSARRQLGAGRARRVARARGRPGAAGRQAPLPAAARGLSGPTAAASAAGGLRERPRSRGREALAPARSSVREALAAGLRAGLACALYSFGRPTGASGRWVGSVSSRRKPLRRGSAVFENSTACASAIRIGSWCASRFDPPRERLERSRGTAKSQVEKYPVMVRDHGV